MDYKKLYHTSQKQYNRAMSANAKLREALTKAQERIIYLEKQLDKHKSLEDLIKSIKE